MSLVVSITTAVQLKTNGLHKGIYLFQVHKTTSSLYELLSAERHFPVKVGCCSHDVLSEV